MTLPDLSLGRPEGASAPRNARRAVPVPPRARLDRLALLRRLQTSLEPVELLRLLSAGLAPHVDHEGLSLLHPQHPAQVGDGGFCTADWPLRRDREVIATLRVHSCTPLDEMELRTLAVATELLAQPMANALHCEDLRRHAREDALTGLYNRAALERMLPREAALAEREARPLSLLMLDLDHFKRVNDRRGHAVGDALLRLFAEVLRECLRQSDLAFRYGGEEFVVLLPDTDPAGACQAARRIAASLKQRAAASLGLDASVSVGVAAAGEHAAGPARLLQSADRALYLAKELGRDRVCLA